MSRILATGLAAVTAVGVLLVPTAPSRHGGVAGAPVASAPPAAADSGSGSGAGPVARLGATAELVLPGPAPPERVGAQGAASSRGSAVPARRTPASGPRWRWPIVPRPAVLRRFRAPPGPYAAGHRGLDLAGAAGAEVGAVADGRVTHAGTVAGRGTVTVLHASGLRSSYEPLEPGVVVGDTVRAGDVIGRLEPVSGAGHCGLRSCLHLGARRGEGYVDPWPLLAGGRLALLPLR